MSSLGIRFATPYKGANGIKVNGSTISIDPKGAIEFYNGNDFVSSNNKSIINKDGFNVIIGSVYVDITGTNIIINDNDYLITQMSASEISLTNNFDENHAVIDSQSIYIYNVTNNEQSQLTNKQISFNTVNFDGGLNFVDGSINNISLLNTGVVIPATNKYLMITISGTVYKLIIAQ